MNKIRLLTIAVLPALLTCGCQSMNNTEAGAAGGGLLGAGIGALIGHATGHTAGGAIIGGAIGAATGGLMGHAADKSEERQAQLAAAATTGPVTVVDVVTLVQNHVNEEIIINQIRGSSTIFHLTADDIAYLKGNGVSDTVVMEMQNTIYKVPVRRVYSAAPMYQPAPVVVVDAPPPPPVTVGVGFGFGR